MTHCITKTTRDTKIMTMIHVSDEMLVILLQLDDFIAENTISELLAWLMVVREEIDNSLYPSKSLVPTPNLTSFIIIKHALKV